MKELKILKKGITHAGRFHTDDVISTAFIKYFNPNIKIERVFEFESDESEDIIVYDIGFGDFDHHQDDRKVDEEGNHYCAFGLLWEVYGRQYLQLYGFKNIEKAFKTFKIKYINKMNQGDNYGYNKVTNFYENNLILNCNAIWFEDQINDIEEKQFYKALQLGISILEIWTKTVFEECEELSFSF